MIGGMTLVYNYTFPKEMLLSGGCQDKFDFGRGKTVEESRLQMSCCGTRFRRLHK
jgi:hypothetical protein